MENKLTLLLIAPVASISGYGARSRDIALSLIRSNKYNVHIHVTGWGNTPNTALNVDTEDIKLITSKILAVPQLPVQPDICIQITIPNEFQNIGKVNIGITAGIETNACDASWLEGCNRMDLTLVSSKHSKDVICATVYDKMNNQTQRSEGQLRCTSAVEVLFEGLDFNVYKKVTALTNKQLSNYIDTIPEKFCFLTVGHWLQGDLGQDRKDIGMVIRTFMDTFKKKLNKPALIVKTSGATFSISDKEEITKKILQIRSSITDYVGELPNVYLLHGELTDSDMNELYNHPKVKSFVTFTKGEGYCRPLLEFSVTGKPILASNYSGHLDFLKHAIMLPGSLTPIHPSAVWDGVLNKETMWFTVDYSYASMLMKNVYDNYDKYLEESRKQPAVSKQFSIQNMQTNLLDHISKYENKIPKIITLKLPELLSV